MSETDKTKIFTVADRPLLFVFLCVLMGGALVGSLAVASKIVILFGLTASATFLGYALTFTITDVASELYGKDAANKIVLAGFVTTLAGLALFYVALLMPAAPFGASQEAMQGVFGATWRITLGGLSAYLVSQFLDVYLFHKIRHATNGRYLWIRNNGSTLLSQLVDTSIFVIIAFGVQPELILGQYLVKAAVAVLDTPVVYAIVLWARRDFNAKLNSKIVPDV